MNTDLSARRICGLHAKYLAPNSIRIRLTQHGGADDGSASEIWLSFESTVWYGKLARIAQAINAEFAQTDEEQANAE